MFDKGKSQGDLNNDLSILSEWSFELKMQFNSDPNKLTNDVHFPRKDNTDDYLPIKLNYSPFLLSESEKHLGVIIKHFSFYEHIERKIKICSKLIGTIKHLYVHHPRKSLLKIYTSFVREHTLV